MPIRSPLRTSALLAGLLLATPVPSFAQHHGGGWHGGHGGSWHGGGGHGHGYRGWSGGYGGGYGYRYYGGYPYYGGYAAYPRYYGYYGIPFAPIYVPPPLVRIVYLPPPPPPPLPAPAPAPAPAAPAVPRCVDGSPVPANGYCQGPATPPEPMPTPERG